MADTGTALMGIGQAAGEDRAVKAATEAINSPLLEVSIDGAQGVLFAIAGNDDLTIHEVQEAAKVITQSVDKDAKIIFGTIKDDRLNKGEVKVTVIATGFPQDGQPRKQAQQAAPVQQPRVVIEEKKEPPVVVPAPKEEIPVSDYVRKSGTDAKPERIIIDDDFSDDTDDWSAVPAFLRRKK
jgi:cell division protein FtsZ